MILSFIIFWLIYFLAIEILQIKNELRTNSIVGVLWTRWDLFNILDVIQMILQLFYAIATYRLSSGEDDMKYNKVFYYSLLTFVSWLGVLGALRTFHSFRDVILHLTKGFEDMLTFVVVLLVLIVGTTNSIYGKLVAEGR